MFDIVLKVGGVGWELVENNVVEDDIDLKFGGLGWLVFWFCLNVGVWLVLNVGLVDGVEGLVLNIKEDFRGL